MARLGITINSSRHQSATSANAVPVKDQKWFPSNWRNSSQATSTDRAPSGRMVHVHVPKSRVDDHDWREVMKKDKVKVEPALSQASAASLHCLSSFFLASSGSVCSSRVASSNCFISTDTSADTGTNADTGTDIITEVRSTCTSSYYYVETKA